MNRFFPFAVFSFILSLVSAQEPNQATLTLVDEEGFNEFNISVSADAQGQTASDRDTTTLSGTADVTLNIDPATGTTDKIVINDADISASDMNFTLRVRVFFIPITVAELTTSGVKGTASTPFGLGPVDPATGEFDASLHTFTLNQGVLSGSALGDPLSSNFSETPISGVGTGTGTVTLSNPVEGENRKITYEVTVTLPIRIDNTIPIGDSTDEASVTATGSLKATGTIFVIRPPTFEEWAVEQGEAIDSQNSFSLSSRIPNELIYALGHEPHTVPASPLLKTSEGFQLNLGPRGQVQDVIVEHSSDLINWDIASAVRIVSSPGEVLTLSTPDHLGFYRVKVAR